MTKDIWETKQRSKDTDCNGFMEKNLYFTRLGTQIGILSGLNPQSCNFQNPTP